VLRCGGRGTQRYTTDYTRASGVVNRSHSELGVNVGCGVVGSSMGLCRFEIDILVRVDR